MRDFFLLNALIVTFNLTKIVQIAASTFELKKVQIIRKILQFQNTINARTFDLVLRFLKDSTTTVYWLRTFEQKILNSQKFSIKVPP